MKRKRNCILSYDITHVRLNVHAHKKGCINRLKFATAATVQLRSSFLTLTANKKVAL